LLFTGCSNDYTPKTEDNGESIFKAACIACHGAVSEDQPAMYFTLNLENANAKYVAFKVNSGNIMMPKFVNIKGRHMRQLSEYVLEHSLRK